MFQVRDTFARINSIVTKLRADNIRVEVLKNISISMVIKVCSMVTALLMQLVMARLLGVKEFGIYTYVWAIFLSIAIIGKLGFELASIRFVSDYYARQEWSLLKGFILSSRIIVTIVSLCITCLSYLIIIQLSHLKIIAPDVSKVFSIVLPQLPLFTLFELNAGVLRGVKRLKESLLTQNVLFPAMMTLLALLSVLFVDTVTAQTMMKLTYLALVITLVVQFLFIRHSLSPVLSLENQSYRNREWLKVANALMLSSGIEQITRQLGVIVVGTTIGVTASGIYAIAVRFARIVNAGLLISNQSTTHMLTPLYVQGHSKKLQKIISMTAFFTLVTTTPIIIVLLFWPNYILSLFGKAFAEQGTIILKILLIGQLVNSMTGPNGVLMQMTSFQNKMVWILSATLLFNILLLIIFVPIFDVIGVAIATSSTLVFRNIIIVIQVMRNLKINPTVFSRHVWKRS